VLVQSGEREDGYSLQSVLVIAAHARSLCWYTSDLGVEPLAGDSLSRVRKCVTNQNVCAIEWKPRNHDLVYYSPPLVNILSHSNSVYVPLKRLLNDHRRTMAYASSIQNNLDFLWLKFLYSLYSFPNHY
jgi:hypothetical protein